jgi:4-amino-4-deoxy-L-arabinose transferase-like glycosyltransferase
VIRAGIALAVFAALAAIHYPYLQLPYFWDELGQFIPASLDILRTGDWIPVTTSPNSHPPGVMAYLALVWRVFCGGEHSILATRLAMLALAALGVLGSFLLAIRLGRGTPGYPALAAIAMLLVSPLFYAQSLLAQLDMPAMVFTVWALYLFFEARYGWAALACFALVMSKETGAILPAMFAAWLAVHEKKWRETLYFVAALVPLAVWVLFLWRSTGNALGDAQFAQYNAVYSLHPVRLLTALPRRLFYLFLAEFRWIGTIAIFLAWRKLPVFRTREWAWAAAFCFLHVLVVSVFGGAVLERYLLPVLPIVYAAMGCGFACLPAGRVQLLVPGLLCIGLLVSITWGPPYLSPFENNIAFTDFVQLQEEAAVFLNRLPVRPQRIATAWPLTDALRRTEFGYTDRPFVPIETTDFRVANVEKAIREKRPEAVVIYDRLHEPQFNLASLPFVRSFLREYYGYAPQITSAEMLSLGYLQIIRMEQRGQWIEIYAPRHSN